MSDVMNQLHRASRATFGNARKSREDHPDDIIEGTRYTVQAKINPDSVRQNQDKSKFASKLLEQLDRLSGLDSINIHEIRIPALAIRGALRQVADGEIHRMHPKVVDQVVDLTKQLWDKAREYAYLPYSDEVNRIHGTLRYMYLIISTSDLILIRSELVSYDSKTED